jgi:hypothetical protein
MSDFTISILHPTARTRPTAAWPNGWRDAADAFFARAARPERIEYILSIHESRWDDVCKGRPSPAFDKITFVKNTGPDTCVANENNACKYATGRIIMGIQDDLFPPQDWDLLVEEAFTTELARRAWTDEGNPGADPLHIQFGSNSPHDKTLAVCGAATLAWYKLYGYVLHPDYESMYADNELTERDRVAGNLVQRLDIQFEHRHPTFPGSKTPVDEVYLDQNARDKYERGARIFALRKSKGFPRESVLAELAQQPIKDTRPVLAICAPGEWFHSSWMSNWTNLISGLSVNCQIGPHFGWSSIVYVTRAAMAQRVLEMQIRPDFVFWLDDDNLVTPDHVRRLLQDMQEHPEADIIAGWCWIAPDVYQHEMAPKISVGILSPEYDSVPLHPREMLKQELIEIEYTGFPCVLMRYGILEKLGGRGFAPILSEAHRFGFTGEDISFCVNARKAGARIFVDPRVNVPHLKLNIVAPAAVREAALLEVRQEGQTAQKGEQ